MDARERFARVALVIGGGFYLFTGLTMLFAPAWFYASIGTYPPYNRHFVGDLGTFTLPLGIGLLGAARHPAQHRSLIAVAVAGSLFHAFNHLVDDLAGRLPPGGWLMSSVALFAFVAVLAAGYLAVRRTGGQEPAATTTGSVR